MPWCTLSRVQLFATPWTVAHQVLLSMEFFLARILEWVDISYSRGSSQCRGQTHISFIEGRLITPESPGMWMSMRALELTLKFLHRRFEDLSLFQCSSRLQLSQGFLANAIFLFFFKYYDHTAGHVRSYFPEQGPWIEPMPPTLAEWSLSHWTTCEVSWVYLGQHF